VVEVWRGTLQSSACSWGRRRRRRRTRPADIKSNNPHLPGGEKDFGEVGGWHSCQTFVLCFSGFFLCPGTPLTWPPLKNKNSVLKPGNQ
jgi:hypothetical protein